MQVPAAGSRGPGRDLRQPAQRGGARSGVAVAMLVAACYGAIACDNCGAQAADSGEAQHGAPSASEPYRWPIALGLFFAFAGGLTGAALVLGARHPRATPTDPTPPRSDRTTLRAVLLGTTEAVILADPQRHIQLINPAAEILFGRLGEDVAGAGIQGLLPALCDEAAIADVQAQGACACNLSVAPVVCETWARRADGEGFPVRLWVRGLPLDGEQYLLVTVQDMDEQEQHAEQVAYLRSHDQLTGLLNRQEFHTRLAAIGAQSGRATEIGDAQERAAVAEPWVLCHLDLDQFTVINNTVGHAAGDKLLQQVARLVQAQLVPAEMVARLGGDEFAVLLKGGDIDAAIDLCEGLMQTLRGFLFTWQDRSYDIPMSIGISAWDPLAEPPDDALGRADVACSLAKRDGRNRIHVYREGEAELIRVRGDMHLVSTINQALGSGSFSLFAQPIVPMDDASTAECHFEVLVRMVDGSGALVVPSRFIPVAEHYILMPTVDRWIVSRLFALQSENLRAWHQAYPDQFLFAVNLSGTTVTDEGFLRFLKRQFLDWQIPHPSICFEITETSAMASLDRARAFIQEMSALGCRFALDDFGTGLSSYAYLRHLGVHYLKIDGTFVRSMADDPVNRAMVESINHIGHVLGLKTIAEWVEDERTLAVVRALDVDFAQGYAVGAAVAMTEFTLADASTACKRERLPHERRPGPD
jgi:diguanylate cyclase (GGDEF)-like protein/PAS domain S-box-containing protein